MKPGFEPGVRREISAVVTEEMCPAFDGIVIHRCYSTWSLVHHMEIAARKVLADYLEPHEEGIGAFVSAEHLAPCGVGKTVRVEAELKEIIGHPTRQSRPAGGGKSASGVGRDHHLRVVCEVKAYDGDRLLAKGVQVQVVMNKEHLQRYLKTRS
jgi:predicted thioesterase